MSVQRTTGSARWADDELESLTACPVCDGLSRKLLFEQVADDVFKCGPGKWDYYLCLACESGYLAVRPTESSIGKAYARYYTHSTAAEAGLRTPTTLIRWFLRAWSNAYPNQRYGTKRHPALPFGGRMLGLLPKRKRAIDSHFRYLPKPKPGETLLDVGCGNGTFVKVAMEAGWDATGIDPDPEAVAAARDKGARTSSASLSSFEPQTFDAITMNHVIEHVHDPKRLLELANALLRADGTLFIETPNLASVGARHFGSSWRGIEAPRHLILFNHQSLRQMLVEAGFQQIIFHSRPDVRKWMFEASRQIACGHPASEDGLSVLTWKDRLVLRRWARLDRDEFITLTARK